MGYQQDPPKLNRKTSMAEIPVWVEGSPRWVSGIGRRTTCEDVIRALLPEPFEARHYSIVERWRKVERPLAGSSRLLKLWKAWGDEQESVRLTLRRVTPRDVKSSKLSRPSRQQMQTVHPRGLLQQGDSVQRLLKLVLAQGETIQAQLKHLHERDEQIHCIEHSVHRRRAEKLGSNYLLETYLRGLPDVADTGELLNGDGDENDEDSGVCRAHDDQDSGVCRAHDDQDSGVAGTQAQDEETECAENSSDDAALVELRATLELFERLVRLNKKLEKYEQHLVKLHVRIRSQSSVKEDESAVLKESLAEVTAITTSQANELAAGERTLYALTSEIECRRQDLEVLGNELGRVESEGVRLQSLLVEQVSSKLESQLACKLLDCDSNSDTGLSSLHSSGEEGVLDTLV